MQKLFENKLTVILVLIIVLITSGSVLVYQKFFVSNQAGLATEEVDLTFDPEGPYALLYPRRDGNALILNIKRTASYDGISYELAYVSQVDNGFEEGVGGIDRGVMGTINTSEKKGEYEQEILFGTCSKNVCKYDKDVENGTLTLHIARGKQSYRLVTKWHLQKPDVALGMLTSGDGNFSYKINLSEDGVDFGSIDLSLFKYVITNDLSGAPKLPNGKSVTGKVYAVNTPIAKQLPSGLVTIILAEKPSSESKLARFDEAENRWVEYDTQISGSKLTAAVDTGGIFAVLTSKK